MMSVCKTVCLKTQLLHHSSLTSQHFTVLVESASEEVLTVLWKCWVSPLATGSIKKRKDSFKVMLLIIITYLYWNDCPRNFTANWKKICLETSAIREPHFKTDMLTYAAHYWMDVVLICSKWEWRIWSF